MVPGQDRAMRDDEITFVVATYNRPDTLAIALRSVQRQTDQGWRVLVVGDNCAPETEAVVRSMADSRFSYLNLQRRFGHQSGPNSVGGLLASTPLLAYLNHDDILLPDHIERARAKLSAGSDFFVGAALFAEDNSSEAMDSPVPLFTRISGADRVDYDVCDRNHYLFEPASAWIFDRGIVERIGLWAHPLTVYRPPLQDFVMRAWRAGAHFAFENVPTVLKIVTYRGRGSPGGTYSVASPQHQALETLLSGKDADRQRQIAMAAAAVPQPDRRKPHRVSAALYRLTGIDPTALRSRLTGKTAGKGFLVTSIRRTSRPLPPAEGYALHIADEVERARQ